MNAPGARTKIRIPSASPMNFIPNIEPEPKTSLTIPKIVNPSVNPSPIPIPSNIEFITLFLLAKASALPKIRQFTTINGINNPKLSYNAGKYACIHSCNTVTKEAIITMKAGILTLSGTRFFNNEIAILLNIKTNIVHNPIPIPFIAEVVVPSVGHIPNSKQKVGFSFIMPFITILNLFIALFVLLFLIFNKYVVSCFYRG